MKLIGRLFVDDPHVFMILGFSREQTESGFFEGFFSPLRVVYEPIERPQLFFFWHLPTKGHGYNLVPGVSFLLVLSPFHPVYRFSTFFDSGISFHDSSSLLQRSFVGPPGFLLSFSPQETDFRDEPYVALVSWRCFPRWISGNLFSLFFLSLNTGEVRSSRLS